MTVTRCSLALPDGRVGHAHVQGRDKTHALRAAVLDALLQAGQASEVIATLCAEEAAGADVHLGFETVAGQGAEALDLSAGVHPDDRRAGLPLVVGQGDQGEGAAGAVHLG